MYLKYAEFRIIRTIVNISLGLILVTLSALFLHVPDTILYILLAVQLLVGLPTMMLIEKWVVAEARSKAGTRDLAKGFWLQVIGFVSLVYVLVITVFAVSSSSPVDHTEIVYGVALSSVFLVPLMSYVGAVNVMRKLVTVYEKEEKELQARLV